MEAQEKFTPKYNAASILFGVLGMLGWLTLVGGLILAAFMVSEADDLQHLARFMISLPGLGVAFGGLLIIVVAKIGDAIVDAANNIDEESKSNNTIWTTSKKLYVGPRPSRAKRWPLYR